jgi:hypothetical protein
MDKYFKIKNYTNGQIISDVIKDLYNTLNMNDETNILFVRTPTTGEWLDRLFIHNKNITRILYDTKKSRHFSYHNNTIMTTHEDIENILLNLNKKYDLICIDPFHEYDASKKDLYLFYSFLSEKGTMLCHDCFPMNKSFANPNFKIGDWCGETYVAFIDFAYHNDHLFYGLLQIDTGIGLISKLQLESLKNNFDKEKQKELLLYKTNNDPNIYNYFCENCNDIMNVISFT